jgi:hypothetical protein
MTIEVGSVDIHRSRTAVGSGLAYAIYQAVCAAWERETRADAREQAHASYKEFSEGLAAAIAQYCGGPVGTRTFHVGQVSWMYQSIQEAIDAINADPTPPSIMDRCMVYIWPGYYEMAETVDVPSHVVVQGMSRRAVVLYNATTDMFRCAGDSTYFFNMSIRGSSNSGIVAINGNNKTNVRIDDVHLVNTTGSNAQMFLKQEGANWTILLMENITMDSQATSGRLMTLKNTSGVSRNTNTQITNLRSDMWSLTETGGAIDIVDCQDIDMRNCHIRGHSTYCEGVRFTRQAGTTGTPYMGIQTARFTCKYALNLSANTSVTLFNTYAKPVTGTGTITAYNSTYS